ncbi:hypothetical protein EBB07_28570 [Paenibacillaceae bacterium]|nr:hypothetical protein EBB07_28570 [Paenibacillaceae bacterium]
MYICLTCYEIYDSSFLNLSNAKNKRKCDCPKHSCHGDVVQIDELIAPTIILLNQKGYATKYCCSGHWYSDHPPNAYIMFEGEVEKFRVLPQGFKYDVDTINSKRTYYAGNTIRNNYNDSDNLSKFEFVLSSNKRLYDWAVSLPHFK